MLLATKNQSSNTLGSSIVQQRIIVENINKMDLPPAISTRVSATIGGYIFDIEGLTSPKAKVNFYSTENNVNFNTIANDQGIFHFYSLLVPIQTGDFCFLSFDTDGIVNNPLCFPPPPPQTRTNISGVVLSPSLYLSKGVFRQKETIAASGRTFPGAQIEVFLFEQNRNLWGEFFDVIIPAAIADKSEIPIRQLADKPQTVLNTQNSKPKTLSSKQILNPNFQNSKQKSLKYLDFGHLKLFRISDLGFRIFPKGVFAREGPKLTITADKDGAFSFNLPTQKSTRWRFFVGPKINTDTFTAKSNTLQFTALSWWQWMLVKILKALYAALKWLFGALLMRWETATVVLTASIVLVIFKLRVGNFETGRRNS